MVMADTSAELASLLSERIKVKAEELGFAKCGITRADPPSYHARYQKWLNDGFAGELDYLQRQEPKRANLSELLPDVKSLIVLALNYYTEANEIEPGRGVIARYARFPDYHETMWSRLNSLLEYIQDTSPGAKGKTYCDTGPITERDYAMRAGLGWIGKHTNLISQHLGNWFFLGEILVDVRLKPDQPESTHCGTCTRCMPACPTGAITAPYQLDARRCISYLTIELKGSMPIELRPLVGNRIYGCDDCLAVCPWNKFAVVSRDPAVQPREDLTSPELIGLLSMTAQEFKSRFKNTPILRTKRRGFLRNVCVALGNVGDSSALPSLSRATRDAEPLVQEHADWAIQQINRRSESR